jgi:hypothetical protein
VQGSEAELSRIESQYDEAGAAGTAPSSA